MPDIDPVTTQVVGNLLKTVADEVEVAMIRASYSPVIKESFDCSAGILSVDGEYWGQADAIPLQVAVLTAVQRHALQAMPLSELAPGDILITNDPRVGAPHLNDFVALAPVFCDGVPTAFVATLLHHTDVGGMAPGSMPADATELFQEGIRIPLRKLVEDGRQDERLIELLIANTRTPENLRGDLQAQVSAMQLGVRRFQDAAARFGRERLVAAIEAYLDYTEQLTRHGIRNTLTPGTYAATRFIEDPNPAAEDDAPPVASIVAEVTIGDGMVSVDFTRSSAQVPLPINVVESNSAAVSVIALRCMLPNDIPSNGGLQRALTVRTRSGSIMNPTLPAPVGARALAAAIAFDAVMECFAQASPAHAVATSSGGTTMPFTWMPVSRNGGILVDNSLTGGYGARAAGDGLSAVDNTVTNAMNYPAEVMEQEHPVLVERHELRAGSGGAGRYSGGVGLRRAVRLLEDGILSVRGFRHRIGPPGVFGGGSGAVTSFALRRDGIELPLPTQASGIPTRAGDVFVAETPGGGGLGDPAERPLERIRSDIERGLETEASARAKYGARVEGERIA
jgi:N-methylhydantoinase B